MALSPCRMCADQTEDIGMEQQSLRKTFKHKLMPTPQQEQALACVVRRCRELYNAALQERRDAWQKSGGGITAARQSAQLPVVKAVRPDNRRLHSPALHGGRTRPDRDFHAFF